MCALALGLKIVKSRCQENEGRGGQWHHNGIQGIFLLVVLIGDGGGRRAAQLWVLRQMVCWRRALRWRARRRGGRVEAAVSSMQYPRGEREGQ